MKAYKTFYRNMNSIRIVEYTDQYQPVFERLNRTWIEENFKLEASDITVLGQPRKHLIDTGGHILVALYDHEPAGTVALKKVNDHEYEFTKMAVDQNFRRRGIAQILTYAAIEKGRELGAHKIILYSNTLQSAAIALYRKTGFMEVPLNEFVYERGNIKMELSLLPMTPSRRKEILESYGQAPERIKTALKKFPRDMWTWKPPHGKWSIQENIVHLADSEANSYIRCRRLMAEPGSLVLAYNQDAWAQQLHYQEQSADDALVLFEQLRKMSYRLIQHMPEKYWEHTIEHPENGTMTFIQWLMTYENHTHIGQMNRVYQEWKKGQQLV